MTWPSSHELVVYITYPKLPKSSHTGIRVVLCNKIGLHFGITATFFMNSQLLIKSNHFDKHNSFKVPTWKGLRLP